MASALKSRVVTTTILKFIFGIINLIILYIAQKNITYFQESYDGIIKNWNRNMVIGFANSSDGLLPNEHIEYWKGFYPGTVEGCDCYKSDSESSVYEGLHRHSCSYNETREGCSRVYPLRSSAFHNWGNKDLIQVKTIKDSSFSKLYENMNPDGECKSGFKRCGCKDSLSKGICVPEAWPSCPLSDIHIGNFNPDQTYFTEAANFSSYSVYFSRNPSKNPVADLKIGEYAMCENPEVWGLTPGRNVYRLYGGSTSNCVIDTRYSKLDDMGELTLFELNNVNYQRLTRFSTSNNYIWSRFFRRVIEWRPECHPEVERLGNMQSSLKSNRNICLAMTIISYITIIACLLIQLAELYVILQDKPYTENQMWIVARIKTGVSSLNIPILLVIVLKGKPLMDYFAFVAGRQCSDIFTNKYFTGLHATLERDVYYLNVTALVIGCIVLAFDVSDAVWYMIKSRGYGDVYRGDDSDI